MYVYEYLVYLYCLKSIGEQSVAGKHPSSVLVPLGSFCSGFFGNILIAAWEGPLLYTEEILWDSRPPCDDLCSVLFRMTQYKFHQSYQAIQYIQGSRSYDQQYSIMCTLHLHTLLTECYTHIADNTVDTWIASGVLTF